jgi:hypothetical protein
LAGRRAQVPPTRESVCVRSEIAAVEQRLPDGPNGPFIRDLPSGSRMAAIGPMQRLRQFRILEQEIPFSSA